MYLPATIHHCKLQPENLVFRAKTNPSLNLSNRLSLKPDLREPLHLQALLSLCRHEHQFVLQFAELCQRIFPRCFKIPRAPWEGEAQDVVQRNLPESKLSALTGTEVLLPRQCHAQQGERLGGSSPQKETLQSGRRATTRFGHFSNGLPALLPAGGEEC